MYIICTCVVNPISIQITTVAGADPGRVQRVTWNPPFERASLTRDTLIEQSNRDTLIEQSQ